MQSGESPLAEMSRVFVSPAMHPGVQTGAIRCCCARRTMNTKSQQQFPHTGTPAPGNDSFRAGVTLFIARSIRLDRCLWRVNGDGPLCGSSHLNKCRRFSQTVATGSWIERHRTVGGSFSPATHQPDSPFRLSMATVRIAESWRSIPVGRPTRPKTLAEDLIRQRGDTTSVTPMRRSPLPKLVQ